MPSQSAKRNFPTSVSAPSMPMAPPALPTASRPSTVPPDWPSVTSAHDLRIPYAASPLAPSAPSPMRRYRSATPSVLSYSSVPVPIPAPSGHDRGGYEYWRPSSAYEIGPPPAPPPLNMPYGGDMIQPGYGLGVGPYLSPSVGE